MAKHALCTLSMPGTPDLLNLHVSFPERYPFLLESVATSVDGGCQSRYDILFALPGQQLVLLPDGSLRGCESGKGNFLDALDRCWQDQKRDATDKHGLPFRGGWFLYLGYELAAQIEARLNLPMPDHPVACATRIPAAIIVDHDSNTTWLVAEEGFQLDVLQADLSLAALTRTGTQALSLPVVEDEPQAYLDAVARVKSYIREGDVFQVNLSRAWQGSHAANLQPSQVYANLRRSNPSPFAGLATYDWGSIISSSPERLVRVQERRVDTRPIAGTRRREQDPQADEALRQELIGHPKERAEHIMLIDLERNDLGRVCEPGTVKVDELMVLETYAHVHHIVSNVTGRLREGVSPGKVIRAVFPGGTITGCPKERCMAIIAELEQTPRGAYTGSMGYLNHNGDMDLNILIRTVTMTPGRLSMRAGAGLVADSVAEAELDETRHKARGMLLAIKG